MTKSSQSRTIAAVDALLPQTQCELCEHPGCLPYATAIIEQGESLDRCLPGGVRTLKALGELLQQDIQPLIQSMSDRAKPALLAVIREDECIGCTKCIPACPVDAIIGSGKKMHTVITDACNGCELCIEPCPVDCIDLIELPQRDDAALVALTDQSRQRFEFHQTRLKRADDIEKNKHQTAKLDQGNNTVDARRAAIQAALERVKAQQGKADE